jgi:hypothetical protein
MKIVICGSMTASRRMLELQKQLIIKGHKVILPESVDKYVKSENIEKLHSESTKIKIQFDLIRGYYRKIQKSNAILVVNVDRKGIKNYIGGNSFLEIGFAHVLGKKIFLLNSIPQMSYNDEIKAMKPTVLNGNLSSIK